MDISKTVMSFRDLLKFTLPILGQAGISAEGDRWDDYAETAFDLVVGCFLERYGYDLSWRYGHWPRTKHGQPSPIRTTVEASNEILIGNLDQTKELTIQYSQAELADGHKIEFAFREFSHPFLKENSADALNYVLGEIVDAEQPISPGSRICAPVTRCRFWLAPGF